MAPKRPLGLQPRFLMAVCTLYGTLLMLVSLMLMGEDDASQPQGLTLARLQRDHRVDDGLARELAPVSNKGLHRYSWDNPPRFHNDQDNDARDSPQNKAHIAAGTYSNGNGVGDNNYNSYNNNNKNNNEINNLTLSLRHLEANSVLMRRLKETRQLLAARVKAESASLPGIGRADYGYESFIRQRPDDSLAGKDYSAVVPFQRLAHGFYAYAAFLDTRLAGRPRVRILLLCPSDKAGSEPSWQATCEFQSLRHIRKDAFVGDNANNIVENGDNHTNTRRHDKRGEGGRREKRGGGGGGRVVDTEQDEVFEVRAQKYAMCENHGKKYGGWILTCPLTRRGQGNSYKHRRLSSDVHDEWPTSVSLSLVYGQGQESDMPIRLPLKRIGGISENRMNQIGDAMDNVARNIDDRIKGPTKKTKTWMKSPILRQQKSSVKKERKNLTPSRLFSMEEAPRKMKQKPKRQTKVSQSVELEGGFRGEDYNINNDNNNSITGNNKVNNNRDNSRRKRKIKHSSNHNNSDNGYRIGVCVPPLHGAVDLTRIVNFVETTRVMGARRVFLYVNQMADDLLELLREYERIDPSSFLKLISWKPPVISSASDNSNSTSSPSSSEDEVTPFPASEVIWNRGQLLAVQHCLYDNMDSFDWLLFMDIDEMLFPRHELTWQHLFRQTIGGLMSTITTGTSSSSSTDSEAVGSFDSSKSKSNANGKGEARLQQPPSQPRPASPADNVAALAFESAIFVPDSASQALYDVAYFQKLSRLAGTDGQGTKVAVRPRQVFEMGIHHLSRALRETEGQTLLVPADKALVHHFREPRIMPSDVFSEEDDLTVGESGRVYDNSSLRYQAVVTEACLYIMDYLGRTMVARRGREGEGRGF